MPRFRHYLGALAIIVALSVCISFSGLDTRSFKSVTMSSETLKAMIPTLTRTGYRTEQIIKPWIRFSPALDTRTKQGWHLRFVVLSTWHYSPSSGVRDLVDQIKQRNALARSQLDQDNKSSNATSLPIWHLVVLCVVDCDERSYTDLLQPNDIDNTFIGSALESLPFRLAKELQGETGENRLLRKNLGYLVAMAHDADVILDADDSMNALPNTLTEANDKRYNRYSRQEKMERSDVEVLAVRLDSRSNESSIYERGEFQGSKFILRQIEDFELYSLEVREAGGRRKPGLANHYAHFGLATFFPRGWFRNETRHTYAPWMYPRNNDSAIPVAAQAALMWKHPDVVGKRWTTPEFPKYHVRPAPLKDPVAFAAGTFGLMHSSHIFFSRSAYSMLYLPAFVDTPIADVWRGMLMQRILWHRGEHIAFYPSFNNRSLLLFDDRELRERFNDTNIDGSKLFEQLLEALVEWQPQSQQFSEASVASDGLEWSLMEALHHRDLVSGKELKLFDAWLSDLKAINRSQWNVLKSHNSVNETTGEPSGLGSRSVKVWQWRPILTQELIEEHRPTVLVKTPGKVKIAFLVNTKLSPDSFPPHLRYFPDNTVLLGRNHKVQAEGMIHSPVSWSHGRNILLQEVYRLERFHGYFVEYWIALDDDIIIECIPLTPDGKLDFEREWEIATNSTDPTLVRTCYQTFVNLATAGQPAVLIPARVNQKSPNIYSPLMDIDQMFMAIHREALGVILPYMTMLERHSWWYSGSSFVDQVWTTYPGSLAKAGPVVAVNDVHDSYPRSSLERRNIAVWVYEEVPKNAWRSNDVGYQPKNRRYDDVCSCSGWTCRYSFCAGEIP